MKSIKNISVVVADDDAEDRQLILDAFKEGKLLNDVTFVNDGEQLTQHLKDHPLPGLILLDLNMPKKDGREVLKEIKGDPRFKHIPVVVLTTSKAEEDIARTYNLGVNSFISKPVTFSALVTVIAEITHYWFEIVELPAAKK